MEKRSLMRFKWWTVECISSLVVSSSYYSEFLKKEKGEPIGFTERDYWILYSATASAVISILGVLLFFLPHKERSICRPESILVWINSILWITVMIVAIIGRETDSTIVTVFQIVFEHPNAYIFSILGLVASILLFASWAKEFINRGSEWSITTPWFVLATMSFFTMLSVLSFQNQIVFGELDDSNSHNITRCHLVEAANKMLASYRMTRKSVMENKCSENAMIDNLITISDSEVGPIQGLFEKLVENGVLKTISPCEVTTYDCVRIHYAMGLSAATGIVAGIMAPLRGPSPKCQIDVAIVLFLIWSPALSLLTISPGPATIVGNLYFGTYICYFLVLDIFITSVTHRESTKKSQIKTIVDVEERKLEKRDDLWEAAYGKLEIKSSTSQGERVRIDSYEALFEKPEDWDDKEIQSERSSSPLVNRKTNSKYASTFNLFPEKRIAVVIDSSSDQRDFTILGDWKQRIGRSRLWSVLLTMSIVLIHTISQYERPLYFYMVPWISLCTSCVGIVTCFRTSKLADVVQIMSIIVEFGNWMYGAYISVRRYEWHLFSFSSPEEIIDLLLGEKVQKIGGDPNVFFGVWISVVTTILLATNGCRASMLTTDWLMFAVASAALIFSSSENLMREKDVESNGGSFRRCESEYTISCQKFTFAQQLGIASLSLCLVMTLLRRYSPTLHVIVCIPLVIAWSFGVLYVTFFNEKATPTIIYFAFWGGICLSIEILSINFVRFKRRRRERKPSLDVSENEREDDANLSIEQNEESCSVARSKSDASDSSSKILEQLNDASDLHASESFDGMEGLVESITGSIQSRNDNIEAFNSKHSLPLWIEKFDDENQNQDENFLNMNSKESTSTHLASDTNYSQDHDEKSRMPCDTIDSQVNGRIQEEDNNREETNMIVDISQSKIELTLVDDNIYREEVSVDSDDFIDCHQFEVSSPEFLTARSSMTNSGRKPNT